MYDVTLRVEVACPAQETPAALCIALQIFKVENLRNENLQCDGEHPAISPELTS